MCLCDYVYLHVRVCTYNCSCIALAIVVPTCIWLEFRLVALKYLNFKISILSNCRDYRDTDGNNAQLFDHRCNKSV